MLNTEPSPESLMAVLSVPSFATNPKVQAIGLIVLSDLGLKPFEEANRFAESVYMLPCHVDLQLMFLAMWYGILLHSETVPINHMKAIQATMNGLLSDQTPPEIKVTVDLVQALNCSYFRDFKTMFNLIDALLDNILPESPYYNKISALRAMAFFAHGMGTYVKEVVNQIDPASFDGKGLTIARLANSALTGDLNEFSSVIELFKKYPEHKYRQLNYGTIETSSTLIDMLGKLQGVTIASEIISSEADHTKSWAKSTQALLEHKTEEALYWARIFTDEMNTRHGEPLSFLEYTLVRAELAARNGAGAKRLLLQMREKGTETYIDDFYFSRAELLLGNRDSALNHFAKVQSSIEKYNAKRRFDFEIAIAPELRASDLLEFGRKTLEISVQSLKLPSYIKQSSKGLESIIAASPEMLEIKKSIVTFADLDYPVLITGETGTGKELIARALHEISHRVDFPFIAINCSSVSDALIESEFFGHASGAFTGAQSAYKGIFREAEEGTVFLDEIADISSQLQLALLRVLESGEIRPVGSSSLHIIKCRVLVATNKSLLELVEEGKFRRDLYYRLNRLEISLPSLRDRLNDIEELVRYFFNSDRQAGEGVTISKDLMDRYKNYNWPGNVRELRNIVQRMRILSSDRLYYDLSDLERCGCVLGETSSNNQQEELNVSQVNFENEIASYSSSFRRKRRLRELFDQYEELKVSEVADILGVTLNTASSYMVQLCKEGIVEKITPTASRQSHYYAKRKGIV